MSNSNLSSLLSTSYSTVGVIFNQGDGITNKLYTYKVPSDWELEIGSMLVVNSPRSGYIVVEVRRIDEELELSCLDRNISMKWAICVVDTTQVDEREKNEKQLAKFHRLAKFERQRKEAEEDLLEGMSEDQRVVVKELLAKI
jgi:hypothetical protein